MAEQYAQYTWSEFVTAVIGLLGADSDREGIDDFRLGWIRQAVIQCQRSVPKYTCGHEEVYHANDLVLEGKAMRGVKPPDSRVRDWWLCRVIEENTPSGKPRRDRAQRFMVENVGWEDRFAMVNGRMTVNGGLGKVAVDPQGYTFYIYPELFTGWMLSVHYDGMKLDFGDDDGVPFDEAMAGAVALFVKAMIELEVEERPDLHQLYMGQWIKAKGLLYADAREQAA